MPGAAMVVYSGWIYIYIQSVPKATCWELDSQSW
jgi:hypothetical protein